MDGGAVIARAENANAFNLGASRTPDGAFAA